MGHCVQAIVASTVNAAAMSQMCPELPRLNCDNGFAIFPVDADFIDTCVLSDGLCVDSDCEFMLLTNVFRQFLKTLSCVGQLAYVETDYFGGVGGQGALVCRNGEEIMPPKWSDSDTINEALQMIGVDSGSFIDRFEAAGFQHFRSNDDIRDLVAAQSCDDKPQ